MITPEQALAQIEESLRAHGYSGNAYSFRDWLQGVQGYTDGEDMTYGFNPDLPPDKAVQVMAHELGHVVLGHSQPGKVQHGDAVQQEHDADAWAIAMLSKYNLPTDFVREHDANEVDPDKNPFYAMQNFRQGLPAQWRSGPTGQSQVAPDVWDAARRRMWFEVFTLLSRNAWQGDHSTLSDALQRNANRQPIRRVTLNDGSLLVLLSDGDCLRFVPGVDEQGLPFHRLTRCEPGPGDPSIYGTT